MNRRQQNGGLETMKSPQTTTSKSSSTSTNKKKLSLQQVLLTLAFVFIVLVFCSVFHQDRNVEKDKIDVNEFLPQA